MSLIDRYISAVAQQLPASRRDDIARELKANILDRLESFADEHGRPTSPADESAVLRELGHPRKVAASFLPQRHLVSPAWLPFFTQCLIYGLIIVGGAQVLAASVSLLGGGNLNIGGIIGGWIHGSLVMFACVTGVFCVLSNLSVTANLSPYCHWRPEDLPPVRQPWQRISLFDSFMQFIGNTFFLVAMQYFLWIDNAAVPAAPLTVGAGLKAWLMPLSAAAAVAIAINLWNLRYSYWTPAKLVLSIVFRVALGVVFILIAQAPDILAVIGDSPMAAHLGFINRMSFYICMGATGVNLFEASRSAYRLMLLRKIGDL